MVDWDWLWAVGEVGMSYVFYRWWKADDTFLAILEVAPDIDIDDLKKFSSATSSIDYATVHGLIHPNDSKSSSILTSQFIPECTGVIHRLTIRERKLEKIRTVWTETKNLIGDFTRHVSFQLVSPKGNFIRIKNPLKFSSIEDQLEVVHVKFDPSASSSAQRFIDTFVGNLSKGIETKEEMLLINVPLTGVGRLEKQSGIWYLIPHEQWGGILTRSSRTEILAEYRTRASVTRFLSIIFGIAASCTAAYLIYQYYSKKQRQTTRLPTVAPVINQNEGNNDNNNRLQCVICLENEIMYSLRPCSHLGLCETCVQQLQRRNGQELCPLCRTPIQEYQRIFLP